MIYNISMVFNSIKFAVFMFIVFILYWKLPKKYRSFLLLIANYIFLSSSNIKYSIILASITLITYLSAIYISKYKIKSKIILILSIIISVFILFSFKYINITSNVLIRLFNDDSILDNIILPVGISFYTLEAIGYLVDVYKYKIEPERNIIYYATYLSFFPTISSGPIEKAKNIIDQLKKPKEFDYEEITYGLKLLAVGLFKKIVLADTIAVYIDGVFNDVAKHYGFASVLAIILYGIQIYADFSGYSDMAVGVAKCLRINITNNFNAPYLSTTIKEFWSKWHISLSSWLKEYVYIPLGGNRCSKVQNYINILITFIVSGLWHGSTLNYIVWGALHGLLQIIENILKIKPFSKKYTLKWWVRCLLLYVVICLTWLVFRCQNMKDVINILNIKHLIENSTLTNIPFYFQVGLKKMDLELFSIVKILISTILILIVDINKNKGKDIIEIVSNKKTTIRWFIYVILCLAIVILSKKNVVGNFIYMGF